MENKKKSVKLINDINVYLEAARATAVFGCGDYPLMALSEEVGEVMGKIAKFGSKNDMNAEQVIELINEGPLMIPLTSFEIEAANKIVELRLAVFKEMGDVIWQWTMLCDVLGFNPAEVMANNIDKLSDRKERNVLNGEGDNR